MHPIKSDPEIMGGTPCFTGTRVPIKNLFDYIKEDYTLDDFLDQFPSVPRDQALAVLNLACEHVIRPPPFPPPDPRLHVSCLHVSRFP